MVWDEYFPSTGWKKQGRTSPDASITADTHGALQRGAIFAGLPEMSAEMLDDLRTFGGILDNKSGLRGLLDDLCDQEFDFDFQFVRFFRCLAPPARAVRSPTIRPVERARKSGPLREMKPIEPDLSGRFHQRSQRMTVGLLHRAAGPHGHLRTEVHGSL